MILDTNALSAVGDGDPSLERLVRQADLIALPVIVLGEYRYGISQSRYRTRYERWLAGFAASCLVLAVDEDTTLRYAEIRIELRRAGRPIPGNDVWIAAIARQHALPLVSRDEHFDFVAGLTRIGW